MIEAAHIHPHESGPKSHPVLFGVAVALAQIFPLEIAHPRDAVLAAPTDAPANDSLCEVSAEAAA